MSYITHTRNGSYCDACGATLGQEEIDFECCDCCGGEGFGDERGDAFNDYFPEEPSKPTQATKP